MRAYLVALTAAAGQFDTRKTRYRLGVDEPTDLEERLAANRNLVLADRKCQLVTRLKTSGSDQDRFLTPPRVGGEVGYLR